MAVYNNPRPGEIAAAFTPFRRFSGIEYEKAVGLMGNPELLGEYESVCAAFYGGDTGDASCERVRLSRRELCRRLSIPDAAAPSRRPRP
jgi:hypothetical protein